MKEVKYLVLGAGPAGLQIGYCFQKSKEDYLIVERGGESGTFFKDFPRHRTLISINKRFTGSDNPDFNMRHDWNSLWTDDGTCKFTDYDEDYFPSADRLVTYLNDFSTKFDLKIDHNTDIVSVSKKENSYELTASNGEKYICRYLIIATGLSKPLLPDIPGIEYSENYWDMSLDRSEFENQRVLIIGKGNSGFETADHLVPSASMIHIVSRNSINMAWKTHYVGHLRAINNNFLDTYQLKSQNAVIDADVKSITKTDTGAFEATFSYKHAQGEVEKLSYDRVLCCAGFRIDTEIFDDSCKPDIVSYQKYPSLTDEFESTNCEGMFFVGTLTHSLDYRKTTSGFIHGFRYNAIALKHIVDRKHSNINLPKKRFNFSPKALSKHILGRTNSSGALWQQPGFLADYFQIDESGAVAFGEQLPINYVRHNIAAKNELIFSITLEYGDPIVGDPFCVERIHRENVQEAGSSQFLHPVIRCFKNEMVVNEHHVIEDLESLWVERVHIEPLAEFLAGYLIEEEHKEVAELEA